MRLRVVVNRDEGWVSVGNPGPVPLTLLVPHGKVCFTLTVEPWAEMQVWCPFLFK